MQADHFISPTHCLLSSVLPLQLFPSSEPAPLLRLENTTRIYSSAHRIFPFPWCTTPQILMSVARTTVRLSDFLSSHRNTCPAERHSYNTPSCIPAFPFFQRDRQSPKAETRPLGWHCCLQWMPKNCKYCSCHLHLELSSDCFSSPRPLWASSLVRHTW